MWGGVRLYTSAEEHVGETVALKDTIVVAVGMVAMVVETVIRLLLGCARKCTNPTVLSIKEYNVGPIKTHSIGTDGTTGYL